MRRSIVAGAVALACLAAPAHAASEAECNDMFRKADVNGDGVLSDAEAGRFLAAMRLANVAEPTDGRIPSATFIEHCRSDLFRTATTDPGAPLKGANSFTQGQARDRAVARGYTEVGELKKDDDGIWRGPATLDGKSVSVAVDYKGNVVSDAGPAITPGAQPMPTTPATPAPATNAPTTPVTPAPTR
ncbi:MAG: hypothetical protein KF889_18230 [Alphaproteobacteria bacterium]|nr:hypothetical protein [Alphaproteobacteria bacterium]MCW5743994.1 hypothetical protein [Alphaproteobacteria bacterium]